ncbi:hypothetical protein [Pseudoalteromonas sp.]|uniref:hypothetical protein n=1 Tax=Pseudoalteromonas sp. TaxID=53249 RepID=UPI00356B3EAE
MELYLKGSGHFAFGYFFGFLFFIILRKKYNRLLNVQLYSPFLPFVLGCWGVIPYLLFNSSNVAPWMNIFMLYEVIHFNEFLSKIFNRIAYVAIVCAIMFAFIVLHYISLVKYCRRNGGKGFNYAR